MCVCVGTRMHVCVCVCTCACVCVLGGGACMHVCVCSIIIPKSDGAHVHRRSSPIEGEGGLVNSRVVCDTILHDACMRAVLQLYIGQVMDASSYASSTLQ